jgi:hypothetical protein
MKSVVDANHGWAEQNYEDGRKDAEQRRKDHLDGRLMRQLFGPFTSAGIPINSI